MFTSPAAAVLFASLAAGIFHEDAAHRLSGRSKEVTPVGELLLAHQPQISLMHQGRGVQRLPRPFTPHLHRGQPAQLVVDQRQELLGSVCVALVDSRQDSGNFAHGGMTVRPRYSLAETVSHRHIGTCTPIAETARISNSDALLNAPTKTSASTMASLAPTSLALAS